MAKNKGTRSRKRRSRRSQFAQFKGKIIDRIEVYPENASAVIGIMFDDRTYLSFDVEAGLTVWPDYSDWKTGNYKPLRRWQTVHSKSLRT
jgi:hypothetical protein